MKNEICYERRRIYEKNKNNSQKTACNIAVPADGGKHGCSGFRRRPNRPRRPKPCKTNMEMEIEEQKKEIFNQTLNKHNICIKSGKNTKFDFTSDMDAFQKYINSQVASGGAGLPEDWVGAYTLAKTLLTQSTLHLCPQKVILRKKKTHKTMFLEL
mgnify:CR=1 FL=1